MTDAYKTMVKQAWKALEVPIFDDRDFVTAVRETREERDALLDQVKQLKRERDNNG